MRTTRLEVRDSTGNFLTPGQLGYEEALQKARRDRANKAPKYPGKCFECGQPITFGQQIKYYGRLHCEHASCSAKTNNAEDYPCSDMGYEDQCAAMCGEGL